MCTAYSVPSMTLHLVFFSCLATVAIAAWKIFELVIQFTIYSKYYVKINETPPSETGSVLWSHCQNILDDPRNTLCNQTVYLK